MRERNTDVREKRGLAVECRDWVSYVPRPGIKTTTQVCALTRNRTFKLLVTGQHSNQLGRAGVHSTDEETEAQKGKARI